MPANRRAEAKARGGFPQHGNPLAHRTGGNHRVIQVETAPAEGARSRGFLVMVAAEMAEVVGLLMATQIPAMEHRGATQTESEAERDALSRKHG